MLPPLPPMSSPSYKDVLRICCLIAFIYINGVSSGKKCNPSKSFTCDNGVCISLTMKCDGNNDCGDNSDEKCDHLPEASETMCEDDSFRCNDGLCIPSDWVCDSRKDCTDGSDEEAGCSDRMDCSDGFMCANHECIPSSWLCDGSPDCSDESDEVHCSLTPLNSSSCNVNHRRFLCSDLKRCIDLQDVCNSRSDCVDGSDEGFGCLTNGTCEKSKCNAGLECKVTPQKVVCVCPEGLELNSHGVCSDIDECANFGTCTQKCTNLIGKYSCSCIDGYHLMADNKTCKSNSGEGVLTFSLEHEVRAFFLDSEVYYPVATNISHTSGVAYDGNHIYWTNIAEGKESVIRVVEDGSSMTKLVDFGLGVPETIAIDMITGNMYISDSFFKHIVVCDKNGSHCSILHTDGVDSPRGIALNSQKGWMYWTDWGVHHCIAQSAMDGSEKSDFVKDDIYWPNGIAIDYGTDRLYWSDASKKRIESIKLDGTDRRIIVTESVGHPFSIAVYESTLYWSDWHGNQILACDKFNGKHPKVIAKKRNSQVYSVHVYNPATENTNITNPCKRAKCSHLCLTKPGKSSKELSYQCSCPINFKLSDDGSCSEKDDMFDSVFIGISHSVFELDHKIIGKRKMDEISLNSISVLGDLVYNSIRDSIMISDIHRHQILSMERKSRKLSLIYDSNEDFISEMEFDPLGNNIYWIDRALNSIKVISLNKMAKINLIGNFGGDIVTDLALAPEFGLMFISIHNNTRSHIDKFSMDGSQRFHFIEKGLIGPRVSLAYHDELQRLFWADQGAGHIMSCDIHQPDLHLVVEHLPGPVSVTVSHGLVFWVNFGSDKLYWHNIYSSNGHSFQTALGKTEIDNIRVISVKYQNHTSSPCEENGGCSHVCLLTPNGRNCGCPFGKRLDSTGGQCIMEKVCGKTQFKCSSNKCISNLNVCDGFFDCENGEDESDCHKRTNKKCSESQFECHDKSYCVDQVHVCDTIEDCLDGSDEKLCDMSTNNRKCSAGSEFRCGTGQCISISFRCDDRIDCEDHSDEEDCLHNTCKEGEQFKCNSGTCIPASWECDGELDCSDASDEHKDCKVSTACSSDYITCMNHKCVDKSLGCNGWDDCGDNSDEINCPFDHTTVAPAINATVQDQVSVVMCDRITFTCSGHLGECLPASARCNGSSECLNNEDEKNCGECLYNQFECEHIKECIPESWVCDGMPDCVDKSDEVPVLCTDTFPSTDKLNSNKSPCVGMMCKDNTKCIPLNKVCDKVYDCEDKSDEEGLCGSTCEFAGCSHTCQETPVGAQCTCPPGFSINADGRNCDDINECLNSKVCSHFCENTAGSFRCYCHEPHYQLRDDRRRCKAIGQEMEYIYLVGNEFRSMTESLSRVNVLHRLENGILVNKFVYSSPLNSLFWMTMDGRFSALDLNDHTVISMDTHIIKPGKIVVDWISDNLYIIENDIKIRVCHFEKYGCSVVYSGERDTQITSLAVDPKEGLLFWAEKYNHMNGFLRSAIKRSTLAGRNVITLMENDLQDVTDLTVDIIKNDLYWSDRLLKHVGKSSYNGTNTEILFMTMDQPTNIDIFEDNVYLNSKKSEHLINTKAVKAGIIEKCGIHSSSFGECKYVRLLPSGSVEDIKFFVIKHPSKQIAGANECQGFACSGICINSRAKPLCLCHDGSFSLKEQQCPEISREVSEIQHEDSSSGGHFVTILLAVTFILLIVGSLIFGYMKDIISLEKLKFSTLKDISMQFHNPGFELGSPLVKEKLGKHEVLQPGSHHYENPIFRSFDSGLEN